MVARHIILAVLCVFAIRPPAVADGDQRVDFRRDVQPLLRRHCQRCHGSKNQEGGLQLNARQSAWGVADSGEPVIVRGDASGSLLVKRLAESDAGPAMPLDGSPLAAAEIDVLRRWIDQGASWPDELATDRHWAYEPILRPPLPPRPTLATPDHPIDRFIAQGWNRVGLAGSPLATPARRLRRAFLALTGVPPTPAEVRAFESDPTADAYRGVVDQLLHSPRYGERWAAPWLDAARYADSNGFQADQLRDNWAYRDWVIRAFNNDMPFDQFVVEQLAGDLLPDATIDQQIATGFHRMTTCNVEAGVDPEANRVNQVVDRVNTTATVFLGTTFECAQCHDHKYDPFTQRDYYRLFAYFNNTPLEVKNTSGVTWDFYGPTMELPRDPGDDQELERAQQQVDEMQARRAQTLLTWIEAPGALPQLDAAIEELSSHVARLQPQTTLVMQESDQPRETFLLIRGDYEQPGERVEPGTPAALEANAARPGGTRLDLARWLTGPENPLLARVTVNRWWAQMFGTGLVSTLEDFGTQAEPPTHPELLDWLAAELIDSGWSMKHLHRLIATSHAFGQQATIAADLLEKDPHNRFLARGPRFRLPAELVRDNSLAVAGLLSDQMFGPPIMPYQPPNLWRSVGRNQPTWKSANDSHRFRRGVYVVWKRAAPYPSFVNFDAPNRSACTVARPRSNTPLQALTLLNDPAYFEAALGFADRVLTEAPSTSDVSRMAWAFRAAVARSASSGELNVLMRLLREERDLLSARPELIEQRTAAASEIMAIRSADEGELAAWLAVTNALLNLDETISF